jgi:hypothetical protein
LTEWKKQRLTSILVAANNIHAAKAKVNAAAQWESLQKAECDAPAPQQ